MVIKSTSLKNAEFTTNELEVIRLLCKQLTAREIAIKMKLSNRTVEDYKIRIQKKIGARNSVGIVLYVLKRGMIKIK